MKRTTLSLALLATCSLALPAFAAPNFKARVVTNQSPINTATSCKLTYKSGGPVLQNVKIVGVYWTSAAASQQKQLDAFYASVVQTPYFDWLREYNTTGPTQQIGRGTYLASYVDMSPPTTQGGANAIDDSEIGPWIDGLIKANKIPAADDNTFYIANFPPNMVITSGQDSSCNGGGGFCAYHAGYAGTGKSSIRYAAIPDLSACGGGCGGTSDPLKSVTITTSHELIEAVTDPDGWNNVLSWYDTTGSCNPTGEIGDICNGKGGTAGTNAVQTEWSNTYKACIDHDSMNKIPGSAVADFSLALDNMTVTGNVGGTGAAKVTSTPVGTATANLNLTITGLPMGVTAAFAPASVMTNASSMVTFTVPAGTMVGMYPFTITGNTALPDNVIHSITGTLNVQMPPPPDLAQPIMDMAQPVNTGNGGSGGGGSGGNGGGTGGNGQNGGNGFTGGNTGSGCSVGGSATASGAWILGLLGISLFFVRRRRA